MMGIWIQRPEKKYKSWGSNRDLITVTLPKRDKFLCLQQLRVCSILASLVIKLSSYKELMFKEKVIPNVLKELDFHFRPTSSNGQESLPFKLPMWMASDLDMFILQPEKEANLSRVLKRTWKDSKSPCKKHVVSSASKLIFSLFPSLIPLTLSSRRAYVRRPKIPTVWARGVWATPYENKPIS